MTEIRNVAIIGAGIGASHFRGFAALPDRFAVHTICDLNEARAQALVDKSPGTAISGDLGVVLANPDIDIVDICLPPNLHFDAISDALAAGKHVACEKPLVTSVADIDRLAARAKSAGKQIFPVFQYRYGLGASQLRALKDAGLCGKPFTASLETHWNRGAAYYDISWHGTWKGEQGGVVLGHAIHSHDWLSFALGPVASVYAEVATRVNDIEVEDCAALSIRMACGALATSSITLGAAIDTSRLRFCFEGLTAESGSTPYAPADDVWTFTARDPFRQSDIDAVLADVKAPPSGFAGLFDAMADALDGRPCREVTLEDARHALEFVSAVYGSARTAAPVSLPLTSDHPLYGGWLP